MEHKAYVFDYERFSRELAGLLEASLEDGRTDRLRRFVVDHRDQLKDPYGGEPLDADWESLIETRDVHQYGDFALTKYYDPGEDVGLGRDWERVRAVFAREQPGDLTLFLGAPLGPKDRLFDPGKLGSYFQTPDRVRAHLDLLRPLRSRIPLGDVLPSLIAMFDRAAAEGKGLYVTF